MGEMDALLNLLHQGINDCKICSQAVPNLKKPTSMDRGAAGSIMIVGQGPGNSEVVTQRAFSGSSGKRLDQWLKRCGASEVDPRTGIYLTSVVKCCAEKQFFSTMVHNCRHFLNRQMSIIQPQLVITLGHEAYEELRFGDVPFERALCQEYRSRDHLLMTQVGFHYTLLPWPHPSGLNRWHNQKENDDLLKSSFPIVTRYLVKS